ncbi:MAG TPA: hypothetical protein VIF62_06875 [Labilithrix sp.]|jgi:phenylalanyl-tRNA synthetase alpha chain
MSNRLEEALRLRDLTDPSAGPHCMQLVVDAIVRALPCEVRVVRGPRVVSVSDNYDALRFPPEAVARDARYTRYVGERELLRTHTSAMIPPALRALAADASWTDVALVAPGVVYRRDQIDRLHTGEPHQIDVWRIARRPLDLGDLIARIASAVLPGRAWTTSPATHPYTEHGLQIDVDGVEIGECGLVHPSLAPGMHGLAMGLGLDRLVMMRKGLDDIRLLRASDPRVSAQMLDLAPWRPVSAMPPVRRDLSIAVRDATTAEELGDRVRAALGHRACAVEEIAVVSETPGDALPDAARARLGLAPGQKNVLLRIVLRDLARTLTHAEANDLRNAIYAELHEGSVKSWAT